MEDSKCKLKKKMQKNKITSSQSRKANFVSITLGNAHTFKFNWTGTQSDTQRLCRGF